MPQLDFSTYFSQFFWLVLTFFLLFLFLSKIYLPKILNIFELRSKTISENIKAAHIAKDEASRLKKEYENMLSAASKARSEKLEECSREIARMIEAKLLDQEIELKKQLLQAELRIKDFELSHSEEMSSVAKIAIDEIVSNLGLTDFNKEKVDIIIEKVKQEEKYVI